MDVGKIVDVRGKKYITIRDHDAHDKYLGCSNCVFFEHPACDSIDDCFSVIFRPYGEAQPEAQPEVQPVSEASVETTDKTSVTEPPKYTIADFVEAFGVEYIMSSDQIARVSDYLEKKHNADYQLYLELKKRFEK